MTPNTFPIGEALTRADLDADLHTICAELRADEPVSWIPALNGWMITERALVLEVLQDAELFTVDDPRFAVKQVMGPNMLGTDGAEQVRHRTPFEEDFKMSAVRRDLVAAAAEAAGELVAAVSGRDHAEVRRDLGAPLAVRVVGEALGLDVDPTELLGWYDDIVIAMTAVSDGAIGLDARPQVLDHIHDAVRAVSSGHSGLLTEVAKALPFDDVVANVAVILFGGIETSETMTATAFAHLLDSPDPVAIVQSPDLLARAIDESLRLEPAVVQIDRFATRPTRVGDVSIGAGDFVMCSAAGANRDPVFYPDPNRFDPHRPNARNHLAFAKGPHTCLGMHLARAETRVAITAAFAWFKNIRLAEPVEWSGSVFRKPHEVNITWDRPT